MGVEGCKLVSNVLKNVNCKLTMLGLVKNLFEIDSEPHSTQLLQPFRQPNWRGRMQIHV